MFEEHPLLPVYSVKSLINASYYRMKPEYRWRGERHNFWELVYVDKGEAVIVSEDMEFLLKTGEMVFHKPNEWHNVGNGGSSENGVVVIAFVLEGEDTSEFEGNIVSLGPPEKQCLTTVVREAENAYRYFDNDPPFVRLVPRENAAPGADQMIRTCLEQLLIYVYRRGEKIGTKSRALSSNVLNHHADLVSRAKEYVEAHMSEKLTQASIALALHTSVSQLKAVFREQEGQSMMSYLSDLRILYAKRLIRERDLNFTQIAEATGYESLYYFSARFKKQTGMTPTEYARSVRR